MATTTSNNIKSLHEKLRVDSGSFQQLQQGKLFFLFIAFFLGKNWLSLSLSLSHRARLRRWKTELQANIEARKTFTQQATENEMVLEELKSLEEGANVYKLIGPMLAKQDVVEATSNVTKRLEFINAERLVKHFVDFSRSRSFCFSSKPLFVFDEYASNVYWLHVFSPILFARRTRLEKAAEAIEKKFDQTQRDIQILQQRIAQLSTGAAAGGGGAMLDTA